MTRSKDYVVADISLADWGRKEIEIAETEMPGLMACREEFGEQAAAEGRAHHRLAAHDHPDGGADRDAEGARRRYPLGLVQHLLDPGPCRRGDRRSRHPGLRRQGRDARGVLGLHRQDLPVGRWRPVQHDPRRWRRRHHVHPDRRPRRGRRGRAVQPAAARKRNILFAQIKKRLAASPGFFTKQKRGDPRRHRGDHDRRQPALPAAEEGPAAVPGDQRQRLRHQVEVRQQVWLQGIAGRRHPPRHRHDDGRQGRGRLRLWRRRQGLGGFAQGRRRPRQGHRGRSDLRAAGGDGRLRGRHAGRRRADRRHRHHHHRQQGRRHARPHALDEGHGDRRQYRPLRQRDPGRRRCAT